MKRQIRSLFFIAIVAFVSSGTAVAYGQGEAVERSATAQEITGNWQLLPLPDSLEPKFFKTNPWPAACQWYSYSSTGSLKSIDRTSEPCDALSSAQLDEALVQVPPVVSWKYDLSPAFQKALIIVTRSDVRGYAEYWEPHIVSKAFSTGGVEFHEGDLLLYLFNLQKHQIVWIRHLRRMI
jgi:hypothetical protein